MRVTWDCRPHFSSATIAQEIVPIFQGLVPEDPSTVVEIATSGSYKSGRQSARCLVRLETKKWPIFLLLYSPLFELGILTGLHVLQRLRMPLVWLRLICPHPVTFLFFRLLSPVFSPCFVFHRHLSTLSCPSFRAHLHIGLRSFTLPAHQPKLEGVNLFQIDTSPVCIQAVAID